MAVLAPTDLTGNQSAAVKYLLTLLWLVFLPTFTCLVLHKSHLNIFFIRLRWPDFQQLKRGADADREWTIAATNQSRQEMYFSPLLPLDLPNSNTTGGVKVSLADVQLCDLSSHVWRTRRSEPFTLGSTAPAPRSPAWWRLWSWWDDTRASRHRSSPRTSPAARRKGCRCAPPPWGTPAPPPPASRWSCRSCGCTLLQTSALWNREAIVGVWMLNALVMATLFHVHRNMNPVAMRHWCILLSLRS